VVTTGAKATAEAVTSGGR